MTKADALTRSLVDQGKLVEAGWIALRFLAIPPDASKHQIEDMRRAFFCGAEHVFSSLFQMLESGEEPTDNDLTRMDKLRAELDRFRAEIDALSMPPGPAQA
jgi:hypothetical protein